MRTFFPAMWPAFFIRVRPASRKAKPACMNITRIAVTTTPIADAAISRPALALELRFLPASGGAVKRDAPHRRYPTEAVARLVPGAGRGGDRLDDLVDELVGDEEDEECLREEAPLEHAAPVFVRDT